LQSERKAIAHQFVERLKSDCAAILQKFCGDFAMDPKRIRSDCAAVAQRWHSDCTATTQRWHSDGTATALR
jgi:hypothetical protein